MMSTTIPQQQHLAAPPPRSCDTFVYVGAATGSESSGTLFGKNSDRPSEENHEVIRVPPSHYDGGSSVECTFINIPQARETLDCILSKPCWMWGCEMGANSFGVVGGNEAVNTLLADELLSPDGSPTKRLLGMDLLRLSLERGKSSKHALDICIELLEEHGQGGPCCKEDSDWTYENSFLFADAQEAYVLETAGISHWAWERIKAGEYRNISNGISIRSNWGALSRDIQAICKENEWWDGTSKFDWKHAVGAGGRARSNLEACGREASGRVHLQALVAKSKTLQSPPNARWYVEHMALILRDEDSGICFRDLRGFCSTGSQISWLPKSSDVHDYSHFFTAASDPLLATYKHFTFADTIRSERDDHGSNELWNIWRSIALRKLSLTDSILDMLSSMEKDALTKLDTVRKNTQNQKKSLSFAEAIHEEIDLLQKDV
eukprot:scaffold28851_cov148-Skeletonema_menzelii.AAC.1